MAIKNANTYACSKCGQEYYFMNVCLEHEKMCQTKPLPTGVKDTKGKLRWHKVPQKAMREVVKALTAGAELHNEQEFGDDNWRRVEPYEYVYYDAAIRHIDKDRSGELIDPDTRTHHYANAIVNMLYKMERDLEAREKLVFGADQANEPNI